MAGTFSFLIHHMILVFPLLFSTGCLGMVCSAIRIVLQVKSGTLFGNVLVSDDPEYAKKVAEETWGTQKDVCAICFDSFFFHLFYTLFYS